jgi:hypothetical protein
MQLLGNPIAISVIITLVVTGAVFLYLRARISELEKLHIEQARILRSFIAHQQQVMTQRPVQPTMDLTPTTTEVNEQAVVPRDKLVVSDESDSSSEYTDDDSDSDDGSDGSESVEDISMQVSETNNPQIKTITSEITMMPELVESLADDATLIAHTLGSVKVIEMVPPNNAPESNMEEEPRVEELQNSDSEESDTSSESSEDIDIDQITESPIASEPANAVELQKLRVPVLREIAITRGIVSSIDEAKAYKKQDLITLITKGAHQGHTIENA